MATALPDQGLIFWPVGTGDSTTVCIADGVVMQIDVHHLECAEDDKDPRTPLLDELIPLLPKRNGQPYLSTFVLTHPDKDHCCGFKELLARVKIGELWHSPRVFREFTEELCDDAIAFRSEARRRVKKTIEFGVPAEPGDRVRIIGYDDLLKEDRYKGFPRELLTAPGNLVTTLDGDDHSSAFCAFVHAPFKTDCAGPRNESSIGLQVDLIRGDSMGHTLLFGDLSYPTLKRIFEFSEEKRNGKRVEWDVLLAPHHCSKSVMYFMGDGDVDEVLKQDLLDRIDRASQKGAHIVASSVAIPASNNPGDNPPHAKAKARYEELVDVDHFICTMEHVSDGSPERVEFRMGEAGLEYAGTTAEAKRRSVSATLEKAVASARGTTQTPADRVGFGADG